MKLPIFVGTGVSTLPSTLLNGLIAYYKADSNGSFPDSVGSSDGTITGATFTASGKIGGAYVYDGTNDSVSLPDQASLRPGTGDFTVYYWAKFTATATKVAMAKGPTSSVSGTDYWAFITYADGTVGFRIFDATTCEPKSVGTFNDGSYHLLIGQREGTACKLFIDDVEVGSVTGTGENIDNSDPIVIGNFSYLNSGLYWAGTGDEHGFQNRALTSDERTELYNSGSGKQYPFN